MSVQDKKTNSVWRALLLLMLPLGLLSSSPTAAYDLTIGAAGRVSIEFLRSEADFHNTLAVVLPNVVAVDHGCKLEPAQRLAGLHIVSAKPSQRGCRVTLDSDPRVEGVQPFAAGTTFLFDMCAQTDDDPECEFVWSSNPSSNRDRLNHVITTELYPEVYPGQIYQMAWEDLENNSGGDFNDLIVVVRVERDSDGDGLWDDWESFGIDTDGDGTINLPLPSRGANPLRKDVFLLLAWMDCLYTVGGCDEDPDSGHNHQPSQETLDAVIQAFANANIPNPDGSTGINLHIETFPIEHYPFLAMPNGGCSANPANPLLFNFDTLKERVLGPANISRFAYHFGILGHQQAYADNITGCAEAPGNDLLVTFEAGTPMSVAGTLMHELGHNLGLEHGGSDKNPFKPNYISVMNPRYQLSGIPPLDPDGPGPLKARIDYSREALDPLVEMNLSEPAGINDGTDNAFFFCPDGMKTGTGAGTDALDWNCDGDRTDSRVVSDVNGNGRLEILTGFWDWANLKFDFQNTKNYEDGVRIPLPEPELDMETYETTIAPELSIAKTALPATVLTGSNITYTITVTDQRPEQATEVRVSDLLPSSMSLVSCTSTDGGACSGTGRNVIVNFPVLPGGNSVAITLAANVSCSVADGTVIPNTATVDFSRPDPDPSNNSATAKVTASNPPPVISGVATDKTTLSPPNHKMVDVTVSYKVTDNCGVPVCKLAVTSNEPVDGPGSGNTSPDWEILDEHHVRLRAERSGTGSGRVYTIGIACTDEGGATAAVTTAVTVSR